MKVAKLVALLVMLAYPFLVYGGLRLLEPRRLAVGLGGALLLRELTRSRAGSSSPLLVPLVVVGAILGLAAVFNDGRFLLFVPVLINTTLLIGFARTLVAGPTMVESLARRRGAHLSAESVVYCRRVTAVWSAFFLVNAAVILWLALRAPLEHWALYTGLVAYLLVGALFAIEATYRAWRFRRYEGDVTDVFFRKLFPPKPAR